MFVVESGILESGIREWVKRGLEEMMMLKFMIPLRKYGAFIVTENLTMKKF